MVDIPGFSVVDAVVGVILLVGLLGGLKRGLSGELSRVAALVLAALAGWKFGKPCAEWAAGRFGIGEGYGLGFAFALIALVALLALWLLRRFLRQFMDFAFKGRVERLGGALCGLLLAAIIAAFLLLLLTFAPLPELRALVAERSIFGRFVDQHIRPLYTDLRERRPDLGLPTPAPPSSDSDLGEMPADEAAAEADALPVIQDEPDP